MFWRCMDPNCNVRYESHGIDGPPVARGTQEHTHTPCPEDGLHRLAITDMKDDVIRSSTTIPEVYESVAIALAEINPRAANTLPHQSSLASTLLRAQRSVFPPLPASIQDLYEFPEALSNIGQERFLLPNTLQDGNDGCLVFCHEEGLRWLFDHQDWHIDGTFKVVPRLFHQMFTIHARVEKKLIPCVYALMQTKSTQSYRHVFRIIKDECHAKNIALQPHSVTMDFEAAMISATRQEFPIASIHGCLFHFTQALWRKIQVLGLQQEYTENERMQDCFRQYMALAFLPIDDVPLAFARVADNGDGLHPAFQDFMDYVHQQWIDNTNIPLLLWNCHRLDV